MSPEVFLVDEPVVVDEVVVAGVARRVDLDALHSTGEGHAQVAKRIKVVPLDDQIFPGTGRRDRMLGIDVQRRRSPD